MQKDKYIIVKYVKRVAAKVPGGIPRVFRLEGREIKLGSERPITLDYAIVHYEFLKKFADIGILSLAYTEDPVRQRLPMSTSVVLDMLKTEKNKKEGIEEETEEADASKEEVIKEVDVSKEKEESSGEDTKEATEETEEENTEEVEEDKEEVIEETSDEPEEATEETEDKTEEGIEKVNAEIEQLSEMTHKELSAKAKGLGISVFGKRKATLLKEITAKLKGE